MSASRGEAAAPHPAAATYARHVNPAFVRLLGVFGYGRVFVRARGITLWDHEGREYLDFLAGFGSVNLGYNHPRVVARLREFLLEDAPSVLHVGPSPHAAALAEALAQAAGPPLQIALFTNSGSEAVEAALKLARAASGRTAFLYCHGSYHGNNLGALSVMGMPRMRQPFEPLLPQCEAVPFGDLGALTQALRKHRPAAFLVEPIQAEGGVILPPPSYLKEAQALCTRHGALLILDEVQTGLGRTGSLFMYLAEGFVPDVLVLAKSLGGALMPVGAALASAEVVKRAYGTMERFDLHGSTFSGNAMGCAAALETLKILQDPAEGLVGNAARMGRLLLDLLRARLAGHPLVREVRGRGLLVGLELGPTDSGLLQRLAPGLIRGVTKNVLGQWLAVRLLERGIVAQPASQQWNVLKLEPPLTVKAPQIEQAVEVIADVLSGYRDLTPLLKDVATRLGVQYAARMELSMNLAQARKDAAFALGILRRRPFQVLVQVTNRCNLRCSFCDFWPNPAPRKDELTVEEYVRVARELADLGTFLVSIEGGEPLLRPDILEIVRAFSRAHTPVLFTSGWHVTAEKAAALFAAGLTHASVSIDYPDDARHDAKRGLPGTAERAWRAVELLRDAAPHGGKQVHVMTVLMRDNAADVEALYQRSAALGVGHQVTLLSTNGFRRGAKGQHVDELPEPGLSARLTGLWDRYPHVRFFRDYFDRMDAFLSGGPMPACRAGLQSFNLDHVGNVSPCIEKIDRIAGNVRTDSMAALHRRLVAEHEALRGCQDCWTACRGFVQTLGNGGSFRGWRDMSTRMRAW